MLLRKRVPGKGFLEFWLQPSGAHKGKAIKWWKEDRKLKGEEIPKFYQFLIVCWEMLNAYILRSWIFRWFENKLTLNVSPCDSRL